MRAIELVFAIGWGLFWLYWIAAAFSMKRGRIPWSRELRIRAVIVVLAVVLVRFGVFRGHGVQSDPWRAGIGLALLRSRAAVRRLGEATPRPQLGNADDANETTPELVTSGPYRLVRHPIYSGILLATIGTAIGLDVDLADRRTAGRDLLHLQRDRRGAVPGRALPRHLSGLQALQQDARAVSALGRIGGRCSPQGCDGRREARTQGAFVAGGVRPDEDQRGHMRGW